MVWTVPLLRAEGGEEEAQVCLVATDDVIPPVGDGPPVPVRCCRDIFLSIFLIVGGLYSVTAWRENDREGHSVY